MRRAALLAAAALSCACGALHREFKVSGTITLAASLQAKAPRSGAVLFIVAKNRGGVPVAVLRIVNPQFPVDFTMTEAELLVPGSRPKGPFGISVEMNTHDRLGAPAPGDLEGTHRGTVSPGGRRVHIVIDRQV